LKSRLAGDHSMYLRLLLVSLAGVAFGLSAGSASADPAGAPSASGLRAVPASDPHFRYDGRFDFADPGSPVVIWEASTIAIDFDGGRADVRFAGVTGQVFFDASVDGAATLLSLREGTADRPLPLAVSGRGRHRLVLFKRSEATAGTVHFAGIGVAAGARVFTPPSPASRMRMEFIGDSITVGACDLDGPVDQWDDRRTHDAAYSWAAVTAAEFSADYRNISISGIGVAAGYTDIVMGQVWDRIYPNASSPKADLGRWTPDVVLILLGDNDDSYPRAHSLPFPGNFVDRYTSLVQAVRAAYPRAAIVLLNGAMWAGTHSEALAKEWSAAVAGLESKDRRISDYTFVHWTMNHPRVADHRALARELDAWLRSKAFMAAPR
jgi:lysophospholipase L1-like esterase